MEAPQPIILSYGHADRRRNWRIAMRLVLLAAIITPIVHWRHAITWQAQYRYHVFALWRAQQTALGLQRCPDGPDFAYEKAATLAWERMVEHHGAIARLRGPASQPTTAGRVLLVDRASLADGTASIVVALSRANALSFEIWTPATASSAATRSTYPPSERLVIATPADSQAGMFLRDAHVDASDRSIIRIRYAIDGLERSVSARLKSRAAIEYMADAWLVRPGMPGYVNCNLLLPGDRRRWLYNAPRPDREITAPGVPALPLFKADGTFLIASNLQWDFRDSPLGEPTRRFDASAFNSEPTEFWTAQQSSPNGKYLLQHSLTGRRRVVNIADGREIGRLEPEAQNVLCSLTDDVFTADDGQRLRTWRLPGGEHSVGKSRYGQVMHVQGRLVAFIDRGDAARQRGAYGVVRILDLPTERPVCEFTPTIPVQRIAIDPTCKLLAVRGERMLYVHSLNDRKIIYTASSLTGSRGGFVGGLIWSPDGLWCGYSDRDAIYVCSVPGWDRAWRFPNPVADTWIEPRCFSPDGRWLIATTQGSTKVWVWDLSTWPRPSGDVSTSQPALP